MKRLLGFLITLPVMLLTIPSCQKSFDPPVDSSSNGASGNTTVQDSLSYTWELTTMAYPGLKDYEAGSFVINNTGYVLDVQGHLWALDASGTSWAQKADLPFPSPPRPDGYFLISYPVIFSIGDKGYVTCGHWAYQNIGIIDQGSSLRTWEYDATRDKWTVKADFTGTPRIMPTAIGGTDFALVGLGISQVDTVNTHSNFLRFQPATNSWSTAPDCGNNIILGSGMYEDGKYYLLGDKPAASSTADHDNRLYRFTTASNNWQELARVGNTTDWFTYATSFAQKGITVTTANNASVLATLNLTTGEVLRHTTLPVPYAPGSTAFIFRINNRLYLGDLLQKKIWTCKLG